jgi:transposase-like protein
MENKEIAAPKTLQEAIVHFADPKNCLAYLVAKRWPDGIVKCPTCGSAQVTFSDKHNRWQCGSHHPKRQFTIKVGTVFEDSPLGLDKWLPAMWLLTNAKNGISSWELHRALGVSQKTAWFMLHRIRQAHQGKEGGKLGGHIEVDETFIGGKARNMHANKRKDNPFEKAVVVGVLKRGGEVRATVVENREKDTLQPLVEKHVRKGSNVYTDELLSYWGLSEKFAHQVINHAEAYVDGQVHTNGLENFWSLLKRSLRGTYVCVEPFHLFRYIDEQAFRYNNRKDMTDWDRFDLAVSQVVGKRLMYKDLIGVTEKQLNDVEVF